MNNIKNKWITICITSATAGKQGFSVCRPTTTYCMTLYRCITRYKKHNAPRLLRVWTLFKRVGCIVYPARRFNTVMWADSWGPIHRKSTFIKLLWPLTCALCYPVLAAVYCVYPRPWGSRRSVAASGPPSFRASATVISTDESCDTRVFNRFAWPT